MKMTKKIEELIIESCLKIARKGQGALIVFKGNPKYKMLIRQDFKPFNIADNPKLFEALAIIDGATIIDENGVITHYAAMIDVERLSNIIINFGTRHQGAMSASLQGATAFAVSEEDRKVRIFKNGKMIMQIDSLEKGVEGNISKAVGILESIGVGALSTLGVGAMGVAGVTLIPGIIVFGGIYYIINLLKEKKFLN